MSGPIPGCGKEFGDAKAEDCAELKWSLLSVHIQWCSIHLAFWFVCGLALSINAKTVDYYALRSFLDLHFVNAWSTPEYPAKLMFFSGLQFIHFVVRSYTESMMGWLWIIEFALALYMWAEALKEWAQAQLSGIVRGLIFTFTVMAYETFSVTSIMLLGLLKDKIYDEDANEEAAKIAAANNNTEPLEAIYRQGIGWWTFSFVAALRVIHVWRHCSNSRFVDMEIFHWQVANIAIVLFGMICFGACMIMSLENVGDPSSLKWVEQANGRWSVFSAMYFIFVTTSTVGFGDLVPLTGFGRTFTIFSIFGGISILSVILFSVIKIARLSRVGKGSYQVRVRYPFIVVMGNADGPTLLNFINEIYHPDRSEEAEDLELVILFNSATSQAFITVGNWLKRRENLHLGGKIWCLVGSVLEAYDRRRIGEDNAQAFIILPSMNSTNPEEDDRENIVRTLALRKHYPQVRCILLLHKVDYRYLVGRGGNDKLSARGMLMKQLLEPQVEEEPESAASSAGDQNKIGRIAEKMQVLAIDQLKYELVGRSTVIPGFSMLLSNLVSTCSVDEEQLDEDMYEWQREYYTSLGLELYEEILSPAYALKRCTFGQVVLDVLERTNAAFQTVYLIGIIEIHFHRNSQGEVVQNAANSGNFNRTVLVNPGPSYPIKQTNKQQQIYGIFIATDRSSILQMKPLDLMLGGVEKNEQMKPLDLMLGGVEKNEQVADPAKAAELGDIAGNATVGEDLKKYAQRYARPKALPPKISADQDLGAEVITLEILQKLEQQKEAGDLIKHPPDYMLAKGGHILVCIVGMAQPVSLGLKYFCRNAGQVRFFDEDKMKEQKKDEKSKKKKGPDEIPIVFLAETVPRDWPEIAPLSNVYFLLGNPLHLFDLERCNFRNSRFIFVAQAQGQERTDPDMVDAESIFCTKFIETQLKLADDPFDDQHNSNLDEYGLPVIDNTFMAQHGVLYNGLVPGGPLMMSELTLETSHQFLPFLAERILEERFLSDMEEVLEVFGRQAQSMSMAEFINSFSGPGGLSTKPQAGNRTPGQASTPTQVGMLLRSATQQLNKSVFQATKSSIKANCVFLARLCGGSKKGVQKLEKHSAQRDPNSNQDIPEDHNSESLFSDKNLTYQKFPRYAAGNLFVNTMFTSLAAGAFFNPSLPNLISSLLDTELIIHSIPNKYVGQTVLELFENMLFERGLMLIGLYRTVQRRDELLEMSSIENAGDAIEYCRKRRLAIELNATLCFLYTCPSVFDTVINEGDKALCYGMSDKIIESGILGTAHPLTSLPTVTSTSLV